MSSTATALNEPQKALTKIDRERWLKPVGGQDDLRQFLQSASGSIRAALPRHLTPERMIRVAMTAATRNPDLLKCTAVSLIAAVVQASQLGLECDGILGQAYLVPFNNKIKGRDGAKDEWRKETQLIPGYKGLVKLARNSGELETIQDRCVFEGDDFRFAFGLEPVLDHTPREKSDKITHAWACALLKGGAKQFEVMSIKEIEAIHQRSQGYKTAKNKGWEEAGPWVTDYPMMCRKTVVKRLCRLLPLSVELQTALMLDDRGEAGKPQHLASLELLPEEIRQLPEPDPIESDAEPTAGPQAKGEGEAPVLSNFTTEAYRRGEVLGISRDDMNTMAMKLFKKPVARIDSEDQIDKILGACQAP